MIEAWCHQCKKKVSPKESIVVKKQIKPNSFRYFLTGNCPFCSRKVCGLVKREDVGQILVKSGHLPREIPVKCVGVGL